MSQWHPSLSRLPSLPQLSGFPLPSMAQRRWLRTVRPAQRAGRSAEARGSAAQAPRLHPWPVVRGCSQRRLGGYLSGFLPPSMARLIGFGTSGPASRAPRSARVVRSRREAMPRKCLVLTHGRSFAAVASADRAVIFQVSCRHPWRDSLASERPARPSMAGRSRTQLLPIGQQLSACAHPVHPSRRSANSSACSSSCSRMLSRIRRVVESFVPM